MRIERNVRSKAGTLYLKHAMQRLQQLAAVLCFGLLTVLATAQTLPDILVVSTHDTRGAALVGTTITVRGVLGLQKQAKTGKDGTASFTDLPAGSYAVTIAGPGYDDLTAEILLSPESNRIDAILSNRRQTDSITVEETPALALETSPAPGAFLTREAAKNSVLKPTTLADALPLIPGIVRLPNGELSLSGRAEHRSTLLVNDATVTDPSTGNFGLTVPIDSVETMTVLSSPFLAQYGGFSTSVVDVSTRKPGEKWNFELNDPLPEFRFRSWAMRGLKSATPRVNFGGPILKQRLYLSESLQYEMKTANVITLPFPHNQQRREGMNSFTEIDYTVNANNILTATLHNANQHTKFANLDAFNPEQVSPFVSSSTDSITVTDRATIRGMLLESAVSYSHYTGNVWPNGTQGMTLTPTGNSGSYFNLQSRTAFRTEWREDLSATKQWLGTHNLRFGDALGGTAIRGLVSNSSVDLRDGRANLIETIRYTAAQDSIHHSDVELAFYAQDHWVVNSKLALELGARIERQRVTNNFRLGPRGGFAWSPFSNTVVRAGVGVFYDRVPLNIYGFSGYPEATITKFNADGSVLGGPDTYLNLTARVARIKFPFVYGGKNPLPGSFTPYSLNWNFQVEQTVTPRLRFRASYLQSASEGLLTLDPQLVETQHVFLLSGNGESFLRQLEFTAALRTGRDSQMFLSYVHSRSTGNLNEFSNYLSSFPIAVILPDRYASLPGDIPNRILAWGIFSLPGKTKVMPKAEYRTGFPYSPLDEFQTYVGNPNEKRYPRFLSLDMRVSKDFKINDKYSVRFSVTGANLSNHFNPVSVHANTGDLSYGVFFGQYRRRYTADFDFLF